MAGHQIIPERLFERPFKLNIINSLINGGLKTLTGTLDFPTGEIIYKVHARHKEIITTHSIMDAIKAYNEADVQE